MVKYPKNAIHLSQVKDAGDGGLQFDQLHFFVWTNAFHRADNRPEPTRIDKRHMIQPQGDVQIMLRTDLANLFFEFNGLKRINPCRFGS